ncbi:MAG: group 1 truncated hemoglobin [Planctomycetota bacterium]|nr:MAG: group 1 truncated hemoglobin [Planctomycetota bacterium]
MTDDSLFARLGGYDAISAVAHELLRRLRADEQLGRFWAHRGSDGIARERQLLIDFLCANAGGPMYYTGRDMQTSHEGMAISASDWDVFIGHLGATLDSFDVPQTEHEQVIAFIETTRDDIVEA